MPKTFRMPAPSVLGRVQAFLPQIAAANTQLDARLAEGGEAARREVLIDAEVAADAGAGEGAGEGRHVEMQLYMGVLEPTPRDAARAGSGIMDEARLAGAAAQAEMVAAEGDEGAEGLAAEALGAGVDQLAHAMAMGVLGRSEVRRPAFNSPPRPHPAAAGRRHRRWRRRRGQRGRGRGREEA